jgi:putative NADPH-quinone reductase
MSQNLRSHVVWSHPRVDSLTAAIVRNTIEQLNDRDIEVDELDLYRYGFDPVLREVDEPDWKDEAKAYSPETEALVERVQRADLFVAIFPLVRITCNAKRLF